MNPGDAIAKIRDTVSERAKALGLVLMTFDFKPGKVDGVHQISTVFRVQTGDELKEIEKNRIDLQIKQMEQSEKESNQDSKFLDKKGASEEAIRKLAERLDDPRKGLFD